MPSLRFANFWPLLVAVAAATLTVQASPAKYPKRLVNGRMVDLTSLCVWWTNHSGTRPLSGWVHLTGAVTATNSWGWLVEGPALTQVHTGKSEADKNSSNATAHKALLLHPPLQDIATFGQLSAQLKSLNEQRNQWAKQEANIKGTEKAVSQEQSATRHNRVRSSALAQENKSLSARDKEAKAQLDLLDKQIRVIKGELAGYPSSDHYVLDCFALDTGQEQNGIPVYDHGSVYPQ